MKGCESSLTTSPAESTGNSAAVAASEALRCVFPESLAGTTLCYGSMLGSTSEESSSATPSSLLLGRGEDCALRLVGPETSRHHALIERLGPLFVVRDLGSRNGVFVNAARVERAPLSVGSVLRLGECVLLVVKTRSADATGFAELGPGLFGGCVLREVIELARRSAKSTLPIILEGETGTGKELFARAIHEWSGRSGPFRAVNCSALPEGLAEAELFGYRKGAFTGADRASLGHFRAADGGTLLLDEIVDMPPALQAKVLRVLETHEVEPLGETRAVRTDVRVIAAAQTSLSRAASEQRFRSDLLARLDGVRIALPALRERREEIAWIFCRLLARHAGGRPPPVEARLIEQLCLYDWPCNVRELDLITRRLLTLHGHEATLRRAHLPAHLDEHTQHVTSTPGNRADTSLATPRGTMNEDVGRAPDKRDLEALTQALSQVRGNVARAAAALGISRQRAYRLMGDKAEARLSALRGDSTRRDSSNVARRPRGRSQSR